MPILPTILLSQLRIGLYVSFDLHWSKHPFFSNEFKIENEHDLKQLKALPLKQVGYDPARSDVEPLPIVAQHKTGEDRKEREKEIKKRRTNLKQCEKLFHETTNKVRGIVGNLRANPRAAVEDAGEVVDVMVDTLLAEEGAILQLVSTKSKTDSAYYHAINVSTLSLLLGKFLGLNDEEMRILGIGAMLHDIGQIEIPGKILRKKEPLTKAEQELYNMHPAYGLRLAKRLGSLPKGVLEIIGCHHELLDGSGYPKGLKGAAVPRLAHIVAVVNSYDNLCNPTDPANAKTPYEAMALLYKAADKQYSSEIVTSFITHMGVYPPGTAVRLSDDSLGMVLTVNPEALLKPIVLIYDADIPKEEALVLDLTKEGLDVVDSVPRDSLSPKVREYLNLQENVNYYLDSGK